MLPLLKPEQAAAALQVKPRTILAMARRGEIGCIRRVGKDGRINFVRFREDGRTFEGDGNDNANWLAYGAEALAVADAAVVSTYDGLPDNVPMTSVLSVK